MADLTLGSPDVVAAAAIRRSLVKGGKVILAASDALAPREPEPRHGVHMTETGFVRSEIAGDGLDQVAIGYKAFWAVYQHENLSYHHEHGGQAKFLETAMLAASDAAIETVAAAVREAFNA